MRTFVGILLVALSAIIWGQSVSPVDSGLHVTMIGSKKFFGKTNFDEETPRVVYNPVQQKFFVTWMERQFNPISGTVKQTALRARYISATGMLGRTFEYFFIRDIVYSLLLEYDQQHDRYFVAWHVPVVGSQFRYRLLNSDASVFTSGELNVAPTLQSIAYSLTNGEYLITNPQMRFDSGGQLLSKPVSRNRFHETLISDPGTSNYFYFYRKPLNRWVFWYQVLDAKANSLTTPKSIVRGGDNAETTVFFNPTAREFLLVYRNPQYELESHRVSEMGTRLNSPVRITRKAFNWRNEAFYHSGKYYVVYDRQGQIFLIQLSPRGTVSSPPIALTKTEFITEFEISEGPNDTFLLTWVEIDDDVDPWRGDVVGQLFKISD